LDDAQVIAQVRQGNTDAFTEIVAGYQSSIIRYLHRMTGDYKVAEDLAQDTFVKAYKAILKTDSELSFKAWLYRIATNNALQHGRRQRLLSFTPLSRVAEDNPVLASPPEEVENRLVVKQVLAKIPPQQRVCLVLHFVEGFKYREIADILGISRDAVCKRVARGSRRFQILYGEVKRDEVL